MLLVVIADDNYGMSNYMLRSGRIQCKRLCYMHPCIRYHDMAYGYRATIHDAIMRYAMLSYSTEFDSCI
jgi:hypothetical protein